MHDMAKGHPEGPERLASIEDQMITSGLYFALRHYDAPLVTREQLCRVHDRQYID